MIHHPPPRGRRVVRNLSLNIFTDSVWYFTINFLKNVIMWTALAWLVFVFVLFSVSDYWLFGSWLVPLSQYSTLKFPFFYPCRPLPRCSSCTDPRNGWGGVIGCCAAEATGLGFFFFLLSTLVCYQPTELIWAFFVSSIFQFHSPPPP